MQRVLAHLSFLAVVAIAVTQLALIQASPPQSAVPEDAVLDVAAWEQLRPQLRKQLWEGLGGKPLLAPEVADAQRSLREGAVVESVALQAGTYDRVNLTLRLEADHVGRRPAVLVLREAAAEDPALEAQLRELQACGHVVAEVAGTAGGATGNEQFARTARGDLLALRYLAARKEIDPERIAAIGLGAAARRAVWLGALDDRVTAVVELDPQQSTPPTALDDKAAALLAPRGRFRLTTRDAPADDSLASARRIYRLYELSDLFKEVALGDSAAGAAPAAWRTVRDWLRDEL